MIAVNIAEIEKLTDILIKSASDSDEVLNRLKHLSAEIQEDVELPMYTQTAVLLESVTMAIEALNRGNDTLQSLRNTLMPVANMYQEIEKKNKDALSHMLTLMGDANLGYHAAIVSNNIPCVPQNDSVVSQNKVQQLVAESAEEMQVTNIAAITKTVQEEYEVKEVKNLEDSNEK